jgi:hypothetical protein
MRYSLSRAWLRGERRIPIAEALEPGVVVVR